MRLYRDSNEYLCLWCGATREECLDAPVESTALKCCPDCDHGIEVVPVPWCDEHDSKMMNVPQRLCDFAYANPEEIGPCRLQDPPKVWRQLNE